MEAKLLERIEVAIVGAGPYGLSVAAHLKAAGVDFRVFGPPMDNWRRFMPPGMQLKSAPWASCLFDPQDFYTLKRYSDEVGLPYHDMLTPLPLENFVAYGDAFQRRMVPDVDARFVRSIARDNGGFRLAFAGGHEVQANRVVLAVGVHPFRHIPEAFHALPAGCVSHSADYGPMGGMRGRKVAIVGGGASASGLAALLNEQGADVILLARDETLEFNHAAKVPTPWRRMTQPLRSALFPETGIGRGWPLKLWSDAPWLFHSLPNSSRRRIGAATLGPSGHPAMRDRVLGVLPVLLGQHVLSAKAQRDGVVIDLAGRGGRRQTIEVEHVIAATGYKTDLSKLRFLAPDIVKAIATEGTDPVLDLDYQTTVPGLHVAGPAAAHSFGPVIRFVCGAFHPARRLAKVATRARAVTLSTKAPATRGVAPIERRLRNRRVQEAPIAIERRKTDRRAS